MLEAYVEYRRRADGVGRACRRARRRVQGFTERGYHLGHVTGHSIGMTMIEFPKVGEGVDIPLEENMVLSMHARRGQRRDCLYMQDTWLVTADGGVPLPACRCRSSKARLVA